MFYKLNKKAFKPSINLILNDFHIAVMLRYGKLFFMIQEIFFPNFLKILILNESERKMCPWTNKEVENKNKNKNKNRIS